MIRKNVCRVEVDFVVSGIDIDPDKIEEIIGIQSSPIKGKVKTKTMRAGNKFPGYWTIGTKEKVKSKDVNKHFSYLFSVLLPKKKIIIELSKDWEISFGVFWTSGRLYAGDGPQLSKETCAGVSQLNAAIEFDIYPEPNDDGSPNDNA